MFGSIQVPFLRLTGEIFNIWLDVFGEIKEIEADAANDAPDGNE